MTRFAVALAIGFNLELYIFRLKISIFILFISYSGASTSLHYSASRHTRNNKYPVLER